MSKPKLFITPTVIEEREICCNYIESLNESFDVHTLPKEKNTRQDVLANVKDAFAILCSALEPMNEEVVKAAGSTLKVISQPAAGFNNIDLKVMKAHSIRIGLSSKAVAPPTAELAVAILLAISRNIVSFVINYKKDPVKHFQPKFPKVRGLEKSIIGIVGAGNIGSSLARKLTKFDIKKLMYTSRSEKPELNTLGGEFSSLENIAKYCDYVILALPYNENTKKIINKKIIDLMKETAVLVNIGRGGLVDQDYLVEALKNKRIAGAALDVTEPEPLPPGHELLKLDNVLITPHIGGLTTVANKNAVQMAVENILAVLNNTEMQQELKL